MVVTVTLALWILTSGVRSLSGLWLTATLVAFGVLCFLKPQWINDGLLSFRQPGEEWDMSEEASVARGKGIGRIFFIVALIMFAAWYFDV